MSKEKQLKIVIKCNGEKTTDYGDIAICSILDIEKKEQVVITKSSSGNATLGDLCIVLGGFVSTMVGLASKESTLEIANYLYKLADAINESFEDDAEATE